MLFSSDVRGVVTFVLVCAFQIGCASELLRDTLLSKVVTCLSGLSNLARDINFINFKTITRALGKPGRQRHEWLVLQCR